MYVIALHKITDADGFWAAAGPATESLPADVTLHSMFPEQDGSKSVCLWEAGSVERVRSLVEKAVGAFSQNEYYPVAAAQAMGLPQRSTATA